MQNIRPSENQYILYIKYLFNVAPYPFMSEYEYPGPILYLKIDCSRPAKLSMGIPINSTIITNKPTYGLLIRV